MTGPKVFLSTSTKEKEARINQSAIAQFACYVMHTKPLPSSSSNAYNSGLMLVSRKAKKVSDKAEGVETIYMYYEQLSIMHSKITQN